MVPGGNVASFSDFSNEASNLDIYIESSDF